MSGVRGVKQVMEHPRDTTAFRWLSDLGRDLRYGSRSFARSPGFTAAAGATLALGIAAATTIFAALNAVGLRPLNYPNPDRLVRVFDYQQPRDATAAPRRANPFAPVNLDVVRRASTLSSVGLEIPRLMIMTIGDEHSRVGGSRVSAAIFPMLGVPPLLGRGLQDEDERPGSDNVVVISHSLWQRQLGGRETALTETLTLDGRPHHIVGIMPRGFQFPPGSQGQYWTPLVTAGTTPTFRLPFYARLRDGVSPAAAQQEIATIYDSVRSTTPANRPRLEVARAKDVLIEPFAPAITVLVVAVILVLLIACVNVANLVLARSTVREYEIVLRAALGASRARLIRQHLAEGLLLALLSGLTGTAITLITTAWLRAFGNASPRRDVVPGINIPRLSEITIDTTVVAFAVGISILAGVAFGLIAGVRRPIALASALQRQPRRWSWFGIRGMQHALVVAEVTMATMLFVASALMIRSFVYLSSVDTGFIASGLMTFQVTLPSSRSPADVANFGESLVDRIASLPRVQGVAYAESLPMVPVGRLAQLSKTPVFPKADPSAPSAPPLDVRFVSHAYTNVMGIRIVDGRQLSATDGAGRPRVLLINETLARAMFGTQPAVGERLFVGGRPTFEPPGQTGPLEPWEIVGIVADVRQRNVIEPPAPQIFMDQRQVPGPTGGSAINVVVRGEADSTTLISNVRPMVAQLDPQAFIDNIAPMDGLVSNTFARPRLYAQVLGLYSLVAIALVAVGIYGVIAFAVVQRTREIGIRMALGAPRAKVLTLVVRDSVVVAGAGLALGIVGAIWSSRLFEGLLYGVTPLDRATYLTVAVSFMLIASIAAFIPARRASAVDPVSALRAE